MKTVAYYSGKIETKNRECFVGNQKVDCPQTGKAFTTAGDKLDLLPQIPSLEKRSDPVVFIILLAIIVFFSVLSIFRIKIFGKTLGEYIKPIWYLILISIATVAWQYLFGLKIDDGLISIRISQLVWEICIAVSAYKLIKTADFGYGNLFFLGVLYSLVIHGLKATVRYLFYEKTFLYLADRFLYGSLLVMVTVFIGGSMFLFFRQKKIIK
ncbi:hypothetical protein A3A46_00690 [Candidatus Roizmanbacteria bacterium RIFCSPLOWO2_01_FULL_37_13]|uniref:Uncharacterized protein n=1 Tax=Candidatus Roizmanbacteria bacterium RIFCSPHIGHO2_02_FULL_38_11 TaxID=1802039 RepID=A0A1F7H2X0_9BACT|nr:MAG: hypothetical protein A3C25_00380 [Candidatus Roizmanbacteria bacterium RIFCSPHIGHO2_02_FULL_38_11]OGK34198.1 MAG: hypothetical protein A3F58_00960 [Candidatus Roizmanbacteria bacterium RIFCSPHIGHO2_12_FULL_37_9b]OGK42917.1 MAG: hypothetical protein A3A46_00690 [Candidatus Roizmanbacteria bacterium RIFCSPLOWO2_01_FULL_37_13]